jgi:TPP-dependent pyruvate/acetoin dehydrogenase alpha subunit
VSDATATPAEELHPVDLDGLPTGDLQEWLAMMLLIRELETACDPLALNAKMVTAIHSSAGQEAVAVGSIRALRSTDLVVGPHRTHHHALAKGMSPRSLMAELYGRATGCSRGKGGTMHLRDIEHGYLGGNGIVGAGVGLGMGVALASRMRADDQVTIAYVGDGGMNTGRTWESVNLAVVWKVPLIVVCENNLYAVETASVDVTGGGSPTRRAEGFGIPAVSVDGQDVGEMYRETAKARDRAARGDGPTFIEARTYRYEGHQTGQRIRYRTADEVDGWRRSRDPIARLALAMRGAGLLDDETEQRLQDTAADLVRDAIEFAEASPWPDPSTATIGVNAIDLRMRGNP